MKLFLKLKQICILYTEKPQKEKKKKKRIEKFETQNLRRDTATLVLVEDTKVTNKEEGKT